MFYRAWIRRKSDNLELSYNTPWIFFWVLFLKFSNVNPFFKWQLLFKKICKKKLGEFIVIFPEESGFEIELQI